MLLSIIIPTYNEKNTIVSVIEKVTSVSYPIDYEIIIIDDASIDQTYKKESFVDVQKRVSSHRIRLFKNRLNRGKGFSIRKGIQRAKGDIIIIQDADTEYNPNDIPRLIEPILNGKRQAVYGSRFLAASRPAGMSYKNLIANYILTYLTNFLFGLNLTDMETCYKAISSDVLKSLPLKADRFGFEPEITALLAKRKVPIQEFPISYNGRSVKQGKKIKARDFFFAVGILFWQRIKR